MNSNVLFLILQTGIKIIQIKFVSCWPTRAFKKCRPPHHFGNSIWTLCLPFTLISEKGGVMLIFDFFFFFSWTNDTEQQFYQVEVKRRLKGIRRWRWYVGGIQEITLIKFCVMKYSISSHFIYKRNVRLCLYFVLLFLVTFEMESHQTSVKKCGKSKRGLDGSLWCSSQLP